MQPYNKLPKLPPKYNFEDVDILKKLISANKALSKLEGAALSIPNRDILIKNLSVREAVASSGIENINTTVAEVFQASIFPESEISKEQKETLFYVDALDVGYQLIKTKGFLNTNGIFDIQKILEPSKGGIRKLTGTQIKNTMTGEVLYSPPEGEKLIRELLSNFEQYFNNHKDNDKIDPLIKMAVMHYQFEAIHPFYDGNGRTGRILMVLYLISASLLELPILYISGYINKHRSEYYKLLNQLPVTRDFKPWILYLLSAVEAQSKETEQTVLQIKLLHETYKEKIKKKIPTLYTAELVDFLFSSPYYSQKGIGEYFNLERKAAARYLNRLVVEKFIKVKKLGRDNIYYCEKLLEILK